ncbi:low molecular weight phosphatase family protein [Corynebacterium heidelbergense]|uniref:Protein tyrosine phosphatase n=1 Tax=Corynebacterium heidelbergense TaxID=2055947 RepID=A0A364V7M8_9CORY|nr:low molecular weight phosphatase family protein [Corynebacterium heidelbergense]RAV32652.1 protein tyrosine phosphatase [Corynebacterium heidelbergense]WCZ35717.1 Arsenate-mycothiol transferase ArsC2 [Corynebacterium heidelbergense]
MTGKDTDHTTTADNTAARHALVFGNIRRDLHRRYGAQLDEGSIDDILDKTIAEQTATARITTFLPVIVEREAANNIERHIEQAGIHVDPRQEILYVCEHNAGRSQLAASITHHLAHDDVVVRSVGLKTEEQIYPQVIEVLDEAGLPTDVLYQKQLVPRTVHRANVVVLLGVQDVPGVPADRYVRWDIPDPKGKTAEQVRAIRDDLESKIRALLQGMGATARA